MDSRRIKARRDEVLGPHAPTKTPQINFKKGQRLQGIFPLVSPCHDEKTKGYDGTYCDRSLKVCLS